MCYAKYISGCWGWGLVQGSEKSCKMKEEIMRGWEGEEKNPKWQPAVSSSRGVGAGHLLHLGGPTCRGPGSVLSFFPQQGVSSDPCKGPHSCPSRGHVSTTAPIPIPAPLPQTPSKLGDGQAEGRGQRSEGKNLGVSTTLPR